MKLHSNLMEQLSETSNCKAIPLVRQKHHKDIPGISVRREISSKRLIVPFVFYISLTSITYLSLLQEDVKE